MINLQAMLIGGAVAIAVGFGGGYKVGASIYENKLLKAVQAHIDDREKMRAEVRKIQAEKDLATHRAATTAAKVITEIQVVEKERVKEVIKYVTNPNADVSCDDGEWLQHYTAFSRNPRVPEDAITATTIDPADPRLEALLLMNIGENYSLYYQCQAKHSALVNWIEGVR